MGVFHFLNVLDGDCSLIKHPSGHVTVIDINNAYFEENVEERILASMKAATYSHFVEKNYQQKKKPVNPIEYLASFDISSVFRFILTRSDMDHMGGIKDFFKAYSPIKFWDTDNNKELLDDSGKPSQNSDWLFYKSLRDNNPTSDPKRLTLFAGAKGKYFNQGEDGSGGGDGLYILAPTAELVEEANKTGDFNDSSYVVLYRTTGGRILFSGDSHNKPWEYILDNHESDITNVDLLIAPHHGRKSDRSYDFLDIVCPKMTFFEVNSHVLSRRAQPCQGVLGD